MPFAAVRSKPLATLHQWATLRVLAMGNSFQVTRSNAQGYSAEMIDFQAQRHFSTDHLVRKSIGSDSPSATVNTRTDSHLPIIAIVQVIDGANPEPTRTEPRGKTRTRSVLVHVVPEPCLIRLLFGLAGILTLKSIDHEIIII